MSAPRTPEGAAPIQSKTLIRSPLGRARWRIEKEWKRLLDYADEGDQTGEHIGIPNYYRNVARGLGDALKIIDEEVDRRG